MSTRQKKPDPKLAKIYADVKRNFTAADLQKYTESSPSIPLLSIIEELEATQAKHDLKLATKATRRKKTA